MVSLDLNNCFSASGKRCIQILHNLYRYEMPFSMVDFSQFLHWFFWRTLLYISVHICPMIFKLGVRAGNFFNTVTPSSARPGVARDLWHGDLSCRKVSSSSKSGIKLFSCNKMYLPLFKFPPILTNFLEPSLFIYFHHTITPNFTVFVVKRWSFRFPGGLLTNCCLLECSSILVIRLNMILFQVYESYSSYLFGQLNFDFKCF